MKEVIAVHVDAPEETMEIDKIATKRASRRVIGTIDTLAASIAVEGLRHPVLVMPSGDILDGKRRIIAARSLGWTTIPAKHVVYVEDAARRIIAAKDEHTLPRQLEEIIDQGLMLETLDHENPGSTRDYVSHIIAPAVMMSGSQYKRARMVVYTSRSHLRPRYVAETARDAIRSVDAGVMAITTAYARVRTAMKANPPEENTVEDGLPAVPPPAPAARSPKARQLRIQWIRALVGQGATTAQIADRIGIGASAIRKIYRDIDITNSADVAMHRTQVKAVDHNRVMRVILDDLDALAWSLEGVDMNALDEAEKAEWAKRLTRYARDINRASRKIQRS